MKLSEMSLEQRREYNRNAKRHQRAKEEAERMLRMIPNLRDYMMPEPQQKKLTEYSRGVEETIQAELGELSGQDTYIINGVADVAFGLENHVVQEVQNPSGILVGGHFCDAIASEAIEHVTRFPRLLQSIVFADLYTKFLNSVAKWTKKNEQYSDTEFVKDISREIAGSYVLPPLPEPKPEPNVIQEPPLPTVSQILYLGRIKLLDQLQSQLLPPEARRYLDGAM